ncbi:MAG: preprotein translocase subunit SecE [Planctomycetes bacterium]|nr:preprotein translocase subunit SecE [Planctomycetota bacterium]
MNKVTWPTWPETWNSTLVVIGTVVFFMLFLAAADWLLARVVNFLIFN